MISLISLILFWNLRNNPEIQVNISLLSFLIIIQRLILIIIQRLKNKISEII